MFHWLEEGGGDTQQHENNNLLSSRINQLEAILIKNKIPLPPQTTAKVQIKQFPFSKMKTMVQRTFLFSNFSSK